MGIKKLIFKVLPVGVFISLRTMYRRILKKIYKPLSEQDFKDILHDRLGVREGSVLFIHSSIDALNIQFSVYRLFEILLESVGDSGTLVFPAWHFTYRAEDYLAKDLVFDVKRSPSVLGLLSEIARRYPSAVRSIHPINSIVAIGRNADDIVGEHGESIYPCDESSPYYKMMKYKGIIIGIGVDTNFISFVHCPEDVLKSKFPIKTRLDKVYDAKVKMPDGSVKIVKTLVAHPQIKNNDITAFMNKYVNKSVCENFRIRGNRFFVAHSQELFDTMVALSKENKTIYSDKAVIRNN